MNGYPKAIVWDLDGTLIDSAPDIAHALNRLLREQGHSVLDQDHVKTMIGDGVDRLVERGFAAAGRRLSQPELPGMVARFMAIYTTCATDETRLYRGALEALRHFSDAGVRQGICTNKPEGLTRQVLSALSIAEYFSAVIGGDAAAAKKPDPMPIRSCLGALNAAPQRSILIGDSAIDVAAARAADIPVGIVTFGYSSETVTDLGADFLIDDLQSLPASISELRKAG